MSLIYVTSDLHGCSLDTLRSLLKKANFSPNDFLFILGDVIDRGEHGVELLQWMCEQSNVQLILGNHEALLLSCEFLFDEISEDSISTLDEEKMDLLSTWISNGATPTLSKLQAMLKKFPDVLEGILDLLKDAPLFDVVEANGVEYILVHSGLDNFSKMKGLDEYTSDELLWARPTMETEYYDDGRLVIFGHTPTGYFGKEHTNKMVKTKSWVCIDTGAANGGMPMLLRIDDMKEFYLDQDKELNIGG